MEALYIPICMALKRLRDIFRTPEQSTLDNRQDSINSMLRAQNKALHGLRDRI